MSAATTAAEGVVQSSQQHQLERLDDTDVYATAWSDAVRQAKQEAKNNNCVVKWGGRGQGGRGLARRTFQPLDIVVPSVRLEYVGSIKSASATTATTTAVASEAAAVATKGQARVLLEHAHLKLLSGHIYALTGANGCGKSSLLRRMAAGKIPGFPPHVSTLYLSHEDDSYGDAERMMDDISVKDWVLQRYHAYCNDTVQVAGQAHMEDLEAAMEDLDVVNDPGAAQRMEELAEAISALEDELASKDSASEIERQAETALAFMGIHASRELQLRKLTDGQRKKVSLAMALLCCSSCDLLLLDEPTNSLDVPGLLQLRQLVESVSASSSSSHAATSGDRLRPTTVVIVSHDSDFINDVATDVIEFHDGTLHYYNGNYTDYQIQRQQLERHQLRQAVTLEKKQETMRQTLENLKKRAGTKKTARTVTSHKKKMERVLGDSDNNSNSSAQLLVAKQQRKRFDDEPDKSIQFSFRNCNSQWGEPLIAAMGVGHRYERETAACDSSPPMEPNQGKESDDRALHVIAKKDGFLFDCVDLCVEEGGTYCILGENASGKSTLLKILAKLIEPTEGKIVHALNVDVAFLDQSHQVRQIADCQAGTTVTALQYLTDRFPTKTQHEIRGELTAFGLNPKQAAVDVRFLSGGERCRLFMAETMLRNPQVLCLDHPTANLDVESVEALIYGLSHWNGTLVMVSHDANFLRSLDAQCYVMIAGEGKLRRVEGGVDAYLRSFGTRRLTNR